jgi:hypothetical protein
MESNETEIALLARRLAGLERSHRRTKILAILGIAAALVVARVSPAPVEAQNPSGAAGYRTWAYMLHEYQNNTATCGEFASLTNGEAHLYLGTGTPGSLKTPLVEIAATQDGSSRMLLWSADHKSRVGFEMGAGGHGTVFLGDFATVKEIKAENYVLGVPDKVYGAFQVAGGNPSLSMSNVPIPLSELPALGGVMKGEGAVGFGTKDGKPWAKGIALSK